MKPLVGDEIQHCEISIGRGWDRAGGSVMLVTFLTDLSLGASYNMFLLIGVPSKEPE
jgi:hypothetical protein